MGLKVSGVEGTAFGLGAVSLVSGLFALLFLRVDVPWARTIGWALACILGLAAFLALVLIFAPMLTRNGRTPKSSGSVYVE